MEKYRKLLIIWTILSLFLFLVFSIINGAILTTSGIYGNNKMVKLVDEKGSYDLALGRTNTFYISLPTFSYSKLKIDSSYSGVFNYELKLDSVTVNNVFGGKVLEQKFNQETWLSEIVKLSPYLLIEIKSGTPLHSSVHNGSMVLQKLYVISMLSFMIAFIIILFSIIMIKVLRFVDYKVIACLYRSTDTFRFYPICYALAFITTLVTICSCFAGILLGDDGFFYLMSRYPSDQKVAFTMYFEFSKLLYSLSGGNIAVFRLMSLLISLPVVYLFFFIITFALQNIFGEKLNKHTKNLLVILLFISSLFLYLHHTAPDYSILSRVIIFVQLSIIVVMYLRNSKNKYSSWLILCLGFITGINFFIKFSSSVSSLFVILIFFTIYCREKLFVHVFKFLLGIIISLLLYFTFIQNYDTFIKLFYNGMLYNKLTGGHNVMFLLLQNFYDIFIFMFKQIFVIGLYFILRKYFNKDYLITYVIFIIGVILIIGAINSLLSIRDLNNYLMNVSFELLTIFIIIVFENICSYKQMSLLTKNKALKVHSITAISLIFLYVASVGTDTQIFYHIMFQAPIIIFIIVLQWRLFDNTDQNTHNLLIMLVAFCCVVVVNGLMYQSPRYVNLLDQNTKYEIDGHNLYIDSTTNDSLLQLQKALYSCGFKSGDYISGYYYLPDIIFAIGGRSPVTPIYWTTKNEAKTLIANQFLNSMMESSVLHSRFILLADVGNLSELSLGTNYIKCGSIKLSSDSQLFYYKNYLLLKAY